MKLVVVDWIDAASLTGWKDRDAVEDAMGDTYHCRTLGWIVAEDGKQIALAPTIQLSDDATEAIKAADTMMIPKAAITKRRIIRGVK